jgi:fatty-acid desaturase
MADITSVLVTGLEYIGLTALFIVCAVGVSSILLAPFAWFQKMCKGHKFYFYAARFTRVVAIGAAINCLVSQQLVGNGLLGLSFWGCLAATLILTHITNVGVTVFLHRAQAHRALDLHAEPSHYFR